MIRASAIPLRDQRFTLYAAIFDVDGVLLASPHEPAWRDALAGYADPDAFTTAIYQAQVAGKPRLDGARAALKVMGVTDPDGEAPAYAEAKQARPSPFPTPCVSCRWCMTWAGPWRSPPRPRTPTP